MSTDHPVLRTARTLLRPLVKSDAAALHDVLRDEQTCTWWSGPPHKNMAETEAYLCKSIGSQNTKTWVITCGDDRALGWVYLEEGRTGIAELGYILHRDYWGQGLVFEAALAVVEYGFDTGNLRRIFADADPDNIGSIRVMEKLGFQFEGIARANWDTHIGVRDSLIYARINTDKSGIPFILKQT